MKTHLKVQNLHIASHFLKLSSVQLNLCKADSGSLALCLTPLPLTSRSYVNQLVARLKVYRGSCPPSPVVINKYHLLFIVSGSTVAAKHFQCLRDLKLDGKAVLFTHLKNVILRKKPHSLQLLDSLLAQKECGLTDVSHWAV